MFSPDLYKESNGLQRRDALEMISTYSHLVQWTNETELVLDVGCGIGDITWELIQPQLPPRAKLFGADISAEMLDFAAERYPSLKLLNLDISANEIPLNLHNMFHHILSTYCLHWVKNQRQAISNLYKLLRPGGDMLICYLASNPIYDIYLNLSKTARWKKYMQDVQNYISPFHFVEDVEESLQKILTDIGFDVKVCECKKKVYEFANIEVLRRAVVAVNPFYSTIPDNMKEPFFNDYVCELGKIKIVEENNNCKTDKISMAYKLITICASKPQ